MHKNPPTFKAVWEKNDIFLYLNNKGFNYFYYLNGTSVVPVENVKQINTHEQAVHKGHPSTVYVTTSSSGGYIIPDHYNYCNIIALRKPIENL